jgi:hypothetical protein
MLTIRFDALYIDNDYDASDISPDAVNKIMRLTNLAVALNGSEILQQGENIHSGISPICKARSFQGSLSMTWELANNTKFLVTDRNLFEMLLLIFEQQKLLAPFKRLHSPSTLESLRIEYMYMLENPSPNWNERRRFIELSVSPLTVAQWRRRAANAGSINMKDLFNSLSNLGSNSPPERSPRQGDYTESTFLSGPLKVDMKLTDCSLRIELPETSQVSVDISKLIISLVFPVGRNAEEFTGRFLLSKAKTSMHASEFFRCDASIVVSKTIEAGS